MAKRWYIEFIRTVKEAGYHSSNGSYWLFEGVHRSISVYTAVNVHLVVLF